MFPADGPEWPQWTNAALELYHGTLRMYAEAIVEGGVDVSVGRQRTDFGRGFYTTTNLAVARSWAEQVYDKRQESRPAVVRLRMDRLHLSQLASIAFVRYSEEAMDFWSFVHHCREGFAQVPAMGSTYDVAIGPIALRWTGPGTSSVLPDADQMSFHSKSAQAMLNDRALCAMEVLG